MPATLEAPPAASAAATPPPAPAKPAAPASAPISPNVPAPDAKPAWDKVRENLRSRAKPERGIDPNAPPVPPAQPTPDPNKPPGDKPATTLDPGAQPDPDAPPEDKRPLDPADPDKKKKLSPWRLLDHEKQARLKAEARAQELEKGALPEAERQRLSAVEKRAQELEDEIRYVNYAKSQEFVEKYQKPYEQAWQRAMGELGQLTITDTATRQPRQVVPADFQQVLNMPLGEARKLANEIYGDFADDVMRYRSDVLKLWQDQESALTEAKTKGGEREKERQSKLQKDAGEIHAQIQQVWKAANDAARSNPQFGRFFTPVEGDDEGNKIIETGYAFVDKAFGENPSQPGIDAQERARRVKQHAAIRNRAAAQPRTALWLAKAETEIKRLQGELAKYQATTPPSVGGTVTPNGSALPPGKSIDRMTQGLRSIAR